MRKQKVINYLSSTSSIEPITKRQKKVLQKYGINCRHLSREAAYEILKYITKRPRNSMIKFQRANIVREKQNAYIGKTIRIGLYLIGEVLNVCPIDGLGSFRDNIFILLVRLQDEHSITKCKFLQIEPSVNVCLI